jgi:hypothetical protein
MNTYLKGLRTLRKCRDELEKEGWLTAKVENSSKYGKKDLFGLFDAIAIRPNRTKLIQCKTNNKPPMRQFYKWQELFPQFEVEVWIWKDYKGFKVIKCQNQLKKQNKKQKK